MNRIVLIEDDEPIAELLSINLEAAGYEVSVARDGVTGLRLVAASVPDLVLLDVMLPGMGGIEVCRRVHRSSATPVILLSASDAEVDRAVGLDAGAQDYITKPFSIGELLARVADVLQPAPGSRCGSSLPDGWDAAHASRGD